MRGPFGTPLLLADSFFYLERFAPAESRSIGHVVFHRRLYASWMQVRLQHAADEVLG